MLKRLRLIEPWMAISKIIAGDSFAAIEPIHVDHRLVNRVNRGFQIVSVARLRNGMHVSDWKSDRRAG